MEKVKIGQQGFLCPMPMVIVGAEVGGKANYLAVAWVTRTNYAPPRIGVALGKLHHTNVGIREHGEFSVNIPGERMLVVTDHLGLVSGAQADKSGLFEIFRGELAHAPMIRECPLTMECRVVQTVDQPSNEFFIGEIVNAFCDEACLAVGKPSVEKIRPFTLTMPDNRYWAMGQQIGKAWSDGRKFTDVRSGHGDGAD
jgi:flavin reductase (DIM6/NTAB) family NADH-FMN oxidoreductase RutF